MGPNDSPPFSYDDQAMLQYAADDSLDPIQDIFNQFDHANSSSESYSSGHSHSGASDADLDSSFDQTYDGDLMMMYLSAGGMGNPPTSGAGAGTGAGAGAGAGAGGSSGQGAGHDNDLFGYAQNGPSPMSTASSPSGYGSLLSASNSTPSLDTSNGPSPSFSYNSDYEQNPSSASPSAQALFPTYAPYPDVSSFRAPASIAASKPLLPTPRSSIAPSSLANYTPPNPTYSLSPPPSSASSSDGNYSQSQGFIHNDELVRMIAHAQAQGQAQAQQQQQDQARASVQQMQAHAQAQAQAQAMAQAAFNASYTASLNTAQRKSFSSSPPSQPSPANMFFDEPNAPFSAFAKGQQQIQEMDEQVLEKKKRKVVQHHAAAPLSRAATKVGCVPPRSHKAQGQRMVAPAPAPQSHGQPMHVPADHSDFSFSLKPAPGSVAATMAGSPNSVELIANAGIPTGPDAKKVYREEATQKIPINRAGAPSLEVQPPAPPGKRAADKKQAKASKTGEKRKKGDKGHNAVERRYRNNINNAIATLRDIVPALRHLKPLPSMPASRRRASQFTLSTAAQAPTPAGLIDGIPAAKTLSKGTILSKAIEYIQYLQGAREDAAEDIEIFKTVVREMVNGGTALIDTFEERRGVREEEREKAREFTRREQALLDEEDNSDEEDDDDDKLSAVKAEKVSDPEVVHERFRQPSSSNGQHQPLRQASLSNLDGLAQLRHNMFGYQADAAPTFPNYSSSDGFPPSPVSSSDDHLSPRSAMISHQHQLQGHGVAPPRMMLATFMGMSFAGGLGYDWTYGMAAEEAGAATGARAWAGRLVRRAGSQAASTAHVRPALISSDVVHPALLTALLFLGCASLIATVTFLLLPFFRPAPDPHDNPQARSDYRQRRRRVALSSLAKLNDSAAHAMTYGAASQATLLARKELLRLVGAPTYGLLPALAKEVLAMVLRNVTTIRVGSFSTWAEADQIEAAVAWVRIAEIEATIGADEVNFVARCYTFLRLFNLSRSSHWPLTTPTTSRPAVNAILAVHLASLGQPLSAHALWNKAARANRKKSDVPLDPWVDIAISTDFEQVRSILSHSHKEHGDRPSPSDTVPLLRISEARCEAALRESWAQIFVAVVATTCPPGAPRSPLVSFATLVDQPFLEDTTAHVIASTGETSVVHAMAKITRALCAYYTLGSAGARDLTRELSAEARANGAVARLACAEPFFALMFEDERMSTRLGSGGEAVEATAEVDILACATLGWLSVRRQNLSALVDGGAKDLVEYCAGRPKADPKLHALALANRRLLGSKVFSDPELIAFCAAPEEEVEGDVVRGGDEFDLETAQEACVDALTSIMRRAAGLRGEDDSGVEFESE